MKGNILLGSVVAYALPLATLAHSEDHPGTVASDPYSLLIVVLAGIVAGLVVAGFVYARRRQLRLPLVAGLVTMVLVSGGLALSTLQTGQQTMATAERHAELAGKRMEVYKAPGCSCCGGFIAELQAQLADVVVHDVSDEELAQLKAQHGITSDLESCHTTIVDGYVVEGHVPFEAIVKLITERPDISGIALPGMPVGTPGMSGPKTEPYKIQTLEGERYLTI